MKRFALAPLLTLILALAACGTAPTPAPGPQNPPDGDDPRPAKPVNVSLQLDEARKVSGEITPAGGTLELTAADGTRYTLTAPAGAVMSPLSVSMTPITRVDGSPLKGGLVGAVHLEPEGAEFYEPLTLTVHAAKPFGAKLMGFNSHEKGEEFYLQPHAASGQAVTLQLLHFSNPGVAEAAELDEDLIPMPPDPRDRFENDLALDLTQESQIAGKFYGHVKKRLEAARGETGEVRAAIGVFLTWRNEVARRGLEESFKKQIYEGWTLAAQAIEAAVDKAVTACVVNNDPRFVQEILEWVAWVKRNPRLKPYFEGKLEAFEAKARKCLRFELRFESTITERVTGLEESATVRSTLPLFLTATEQGFGSEYSGTGTLESVSYTARWAACAVSGATQTGGTFDLRKLTLSWKDGKLGGVALEYYPGTTHNSYTVTCGDQAIPANGSFWSAAYATILHFDEFNPGNGGLLATGWELLPSGEVMARKTYTRDVEFGPAVFSETTTLALVYAPQP